MRLEITLSHPMVIAAWYATDGRLLARGYGLDEESARLDAALDMVALDDWQVPDWARHDSARVLFTDSARFVPAQRAYTRDIGESPTCHTVAGDDTRKP